jgi:hypothetical protein
MIITFIKCAYGEEMGWAEVELENVDLGDKRINKRAIKLLDCWSANPDANIPSACKGWGKLKRPSRVFYFFKNCHFLYYKKVQYFFNILTIYPILNFNFFFHIFFLS